MLGIPKSQAFNGENDAAPFGVHLHQTAIAAGVNDGWRWHSARRDDLVEALDKYYDWASATEAYDVDRISDHRTRMREYLTAPDGK